MTTTHMHAGGEVARAGTPLAEATAAVILLHGRGSTADNILSLTDHMQLEGAVHFMAPQAVLNTWYPFRFWEPVENNEPALSSALTRIDELVDEALAAGVPIEKIAVGGFSQGACLSLEYLARRSRPITRVIGLAGGLIGDPKVERLPIPDLSGTHAYIATGLNDSIVGLDMVVRTVNLLREAGTQVRYEDFAGLGHSIIREEVEGVRELLQPMIDG